VLSALTTSNDILDIGFGQFSGAKVILNLNVQTNDGLECIWIGYTLFMVMFGKHYQLSDI